MNCDRKCSNLGELPQIILPHIRSKTSSHNECEKENEEDSKTLSRINLLLLKKTKQKHLANIHNFKVVSIVGFNDLLLT